MKIGHLFAALIPTSMLLISILTIAHMAVKAFAAINS